MTKSDATFAGAPALDKIEFYSSGTEAVLTTLAEIRREEPVFWYEPGQFWLITKYDDIRYINSHPDLFSNAHGTLIGDNGDFSAIEHQLPGWARHEVSATGLRRAEKRHIISRAKFSLGHPELESIITLDPPRHDEIRRIFMRALSRRYVLGLKGLITEIADGFLDEVEPGSTRDFVKTVAAPVPTTLLASLVGVPREMQTKFMHWAEAFMRTVSLQPDASLSEVEENKALSTEFLDYVADLITRRHGVPSDDFTSRIVNSELDGEELSRAMALMYVTAFIAGGSDTSRHVMSFLVQALAEHPDQRQLILDRPELLPNAVEESLRYSPVVWTLCRTAMERIEIRGRTIEKDDYIVTSLASANRDEDIWDKPNEFNIERQFDPSHLAFGYGEHACLGASLARLDTTVVLERMLARFPNWELAGEPVPCYSLFLNGIEEMPLRFLP